MVYEMNDLKGILFLVLLKIISITSTNIDCSGNAFHCVNSTHFMICVDLGGGVSITIDDSIIPCPPATVCERDNRFECEYPKPTTTEYPLTVIGITRQEVTEIATHGLTTMSTYVTAPGIYDLEPKTVTEGVTISNVEVLESVNLENDTNVKSASEITTTSYSKTPDIQNDEITSNVKIKTSTHESISSPSDNFYNVQSVIETVLDKPESQTIVKEILNGNIINNNTKNIYETISNKIKFASNYNATFNNEPKLIGLVLQESVNTSTVKEHQIDNGIHNNVSQNNIQKYPQELSEISIEKIANDTEITEHDPTTTMSDNRLITNNFNSMPNASNIDQSAIITIITATEYSVVNETRIVNRNSTGTVLANDFTTSQTITEASLTENNQLINQVTISPTEDTNNKDILSNKNQILESINQTDHNLNGKIYTTPPTERLASNLSGTQNIIFKNSDESLTTTVIPLEMTTFMPEDANLPISYENNKGPLLANEFITTVTNSTESTSRIRTLASEEPTYIQDLVLQSSSNKITEIYENAKDVITPDDIWASSVNVTTNDQVPTANLIERYTTNSISTQNVTNYDQSLSSTTPSTTILLETNLSSIPHRNYVEMMTTEMYYTDIVTSTNQPNTLPTENVHVVNPFKEINHKLKENNITAGFTTVNDNETTTEQISSIIPIEMFTNDSSNMQTMTSYDEPVTTATTTETNTNVFVTHSQRRIADEFITTMAAYTDKNLITEQVNTVPTDASNIQHIDTNPSDDLLNHSFQNNILSGVKKNINDELMSTNKINDIFIDQGLPTSSTEKSFELVNNAEQNYEPSSINPPSVETSSVKLITEYHPGPIETRIYEKNVVTTTTTEPYYTENISFTDHVEKLFTEPTNIKNVYSTKNPIIEQINNGKLDPKINQDKKINVTLRYISDSLLNEMSTIEQDAPTSVLKKDLSISSHTHTNNESTINISSTPLEIPVTAPNTDYSDIKPKNNVLVTTSKGIIADNILFETNTSAIDETYYNQTKNPIIPVNQTNLNNLHNQMTTETSALIIETLVNTTETNGSLTSTTLTEYYNSSYYTQQNITDRGQIANVSTVPAEPIVTTINPIVLQVNHTERMIAQNELHQNGTESNATLWRVKDIATNQTSITVLATIGTDNLIEPNLDTTVNIIDNNQNTSAINNTIIPPTNSTHTIVYKTEYSEKLPEETTETIFSESATAINKVYIETQVDMYRDILTPMAELENLQQFQKIQDKFTNNKTKDVATGTNNETSMIESSPLTTIESVYNDFVGVTSTRLEDNKESQTEKSIVIASTTQHTLQSDDISALSNIEEFSNFMTPSPIILITDKTNKTTSKFNTDSNNTDSSIELMHNNTATLLSAVVEILNTSTSTQFANYTIKPTVDYLEEIVKTTEVNILEPHTDNIIELTTPKAQTANPLEISENRTKHTLVSVIPYSSTTINPPTSISSATEPNINHTSAKTNSDLGLNAIDTTLNTSTTENISDFNAHLSASNIVTELPITLPYYTTVNPVEVSLQVSLGYRDIVGTTLKSETVTETAATTIDTSISSASSDKSSIQMSSLLHGNKQNNTNLKNYTSNNEDKKIVFVNETTGNSILDSTKNTSCVSTYRNPNDYNITDKVFIGTDNKARVKELSTESSTSRLGDGAQNKMINSESSLTTEPQQILTSPALDNISTDSNETINSLLNASIDRMSTGTSEPPEYSKITKNLDIEEIFLTNSTYGAIQDDIGLQISNKMGTEIINHSNYSIIKVNLSEPFHNQGDLREPVRTANNENVSEIHKNKPPNNTINTLNTVVNFVSTIHFSSTTINPSTSISSSTEPNINNTSSKTNSYIGVNTLTTENIANFQTDLFASNIVTELPIKGKYTTVNLIDVSLQESSGISDTVDSTLKFETVAETAATTVDTSISSAVRDKSSIQMRSLLNGNKQNNSNLKNNTSNNENKKIVFVNETTDNSILDNRINNSWVSTNSNLNDNNITDEVFIGTDHKPPVEELSSTLTESSTSRSKDAAQKNGNNSELSLTTEFQQILQLPAPDIKSIESNQTINSSLNTSIDGLSTGTSEPPEYSIITKNLDTEEILLANSTYVPKQDDIVLQISNKMGSENMNHSSHSNIKVNLSEPLHNQSDLKEPVRTLNNENASESDNNKEPNNTINTVNTKVNIPTNVTVNRNISDENIMNGFHFSCLNRSRGKYADNNDCRKFYICIGRPQPLAGTCPLNTVFSEINKQCTKNLSHCVRNNQFRCLLEGRFGDFFRDNVYYICIKNSFNMFTRYKFQCLKGFHLNKDTVVCEQNVEVSSSSSGSSVSENSQRSNDNSESTQNSRQNQEAKKASFECESEGKFPHPDNCRKYYVCSKNRKAEYRRKIKQCSSDEVFHREKKKCIESESNGC